MRGTNQRRQPKGLRVERRRDLTYGVAEETMPVGVEPHMATPARRRRLRRFEIVWMTAREPREVVEPALAVLDVDVDDDIARGYRNAPHDIRPPRNPILRGGEIARCLCTPFDPGYPVHDREDRQAFLAVRLRIAHEGAWVLGHCARSRSAPRALRRVVASNMGLSRCDCARASRSVRARSICIERA
jgi:hypothetical protein